MRPPPTNCPNCNAIERFAVHHRLVDGKIQVYIVCHTCREETVIKTMTRKEIDARRRFAAARRRAR